MKCANTHSKDPINETHYEANNGKLMLQAVMWKRKRKLEEEAPEAATFHGSGSGSCEREMNGSGSGSSKKNIESGSGSDKNLPLPPLPLLWYLKQDFSFFYEYFQKLKPF